MTFKLINSNRFYLPGTKNKWLHLATVTYGVREFICFSNVDNQKIYIEEITGGTGPNLIKDDSLLEALHQFLTEKTILNMMRPLIPDNIWYRKK